MSAAWEVRFSNSKQLPYFYNPQTSQSIWEPPANLSPDQLNALPGARQYLGAAPKGKDGEIRASHILVKHVGSRRASSWKQDKITRPITEAREQIQNHINTLKALPPADLPREFAKIAGTESDCSSARKGGDLGWFGRGMMQKSFEDATYALQPNEMSGIVESDSGVHVILRTG